MTTAQMMNTQVEAADRLARAEREVRIAGYRLTSAIPGAIPLREGVKDVARYRRALAECDLAQAAYDDAQDLPCPEAW